MLKSADVLVGYKEIAHRSEDVPPNFSPLSPTRRRKVKPVMARYDCRMIAQLSHLGAADQRFVCA